MSFADFTETATGTVIRHVASANGLTIHTDRFPISTSQFTQFCFDEFCFTFNAEIVLRMRSITPWTITANPSGAIVNQLTAQGLDQLIQIVFNQDNFPSSNPTSSPTFIDFTNVEHTFRLTINP